MLGSLDRFHSLGLREICPNGGHVFAALHRSSPPCKHQWTMTPVWNNQFAMKLYVAREVYTVYFVYISGYITLVPIHCTPCIQAFSWPQDRVRALHLVHSNFSTILRADAATNKECYSIHPSISSSFTLNFHH